MLKYESVVRSRQQVVGNLRADPVVCGETAGLALNEARGLKINIKESDVRLRRIEGKGEV